MGGETKNFYFSFLILFFLTGCIHVEGMVEEEQKSYLKFSGATAYSFVQIDDHDPFELKLGYTVEDDGTKTEKDNLPLYQLSPGKHRIIVRKKDGKVVVDRILLLGNGITKEIRVP